MMKKIGLIILCTCFCYIAIAQKPDTTVYYLTKDGNFVPKISDADYLLLVLPPDTNVDKHLYVLQEYYKNGKMRMMGYSKTKTMDLKPEGSQISYFPNGHRMAISTYENGEPVGDVAEYYPNGKLYNVRSFKKGERTILKQCFDSTGVMLADTGNGKWIKFSSERFGKNFVEGPVHNGMEEGEWHGIERDSLSVIEQYQDGVLVSLKIYDSFGEEIISPKIFTAVERAPEFPGGLNAFGLFLTRSIRYPVTAREGNKQGRVIVNFVVEGDGSLTNFRIARSAGADLDEEALRVMGMSPKWLPGMQNGRPVRVAYSVPINFTLSSN